MGGLFVKSCETGSQFLRRLSIGLLAFPALGVIALIGLVISQPAAVHWISQTAQAVLARTNFVPGLASPQLAQPVGKTRGAKACRLIRA